MRWYSIGQLQEGFEPDHLTVPKNLYVSPAFRSAYDGADRYRNDELGQKPARLLPQFQGFHRRPNSLYAAMSWFVISAIVC